MAKTKTNPWTTIGRENHRDRQVPARVLAADEAGLWEKALADGGRLKLALLRSRNAVLSVGGAACAAIAPVSLFLHQDRSIRLTLTEHGDGDLLILFHPRYIFDTFTLEQDFASESDPAYTHDGYLLARFARERTLAERVLHLEPALARYMATAAARMKNELEGQADLYWPCRSRSFLLQILIACAHLSEDRPGGAVLAGSLPAGADVAPLFTFLVGRLHEKLTVERIAREFGTNRTSLQEKFRAATGLSVTQYLIRLRVQTASVLLRNTALTIPEIMERTGFCDETHFCRIFRKYVSRSPSEFRKAFVFPEYLKSPAH